MNIKSLCESKTFAALYKSNAAQAKARYERALAALGRDEADFFSVPGRTEIIGNHTVHNHGMVMAASVGLDIIAAVYPTDDNIIRIESEGFDKEEIDISDLSVHEEEKFTSAAIVRGVASAIVENGGRIGGFTAYITSDVPGGSGLSSSAAYENMIGTILNSYYNENKFSQVDIARMSQRAENRHFGKPCGLMDQIACAVGGLVFIDFADPAAPVVKRTDLHLDGYRLCIIRTGGSHADLNDDYASVPAEMKAVAAHFGKSVLREVSEEELISAVPALRKKLGDRAILRALHFMSENKRVEKALAAAKAGDTDAFLAEINASGTSSAVALQNYFTCKAPAEQGITLAVTLAREIMGGKGAARVHGGGFAGTAQAFVPEEIFDKFIATMEGAFGKGAVVALEIRNESATRIAD